MQIDVHPFDPLAIHIDVPGITFSPEYTFLTNDARADTSLPAHEFFHSVQWSYQQACPKLDPLQVTNGWDMHEDLRWYMESTADWAQQEVVNSPTYMGPIRTYLGTPWQRIDTRPEFSNASFAYSPLLPFYLIERVSPGKSKDIIRSTWEEYQLSGNCGGILPVLDTVLQGQNPSRRIADIFSDYTERNYFVDYDRQTDFRGQLPPEHDAVLNIDLPYRPGHRREYVNNQTVVVQGPPGNYAGSQVQRLGSTYTEFANGFNNSIGRALSIDIDVEVRIDNSALPDVKFWVISSYDPAYAYTLVPTQLQVVDSNPFYWHYKAHAVIANFDRANWVAVAVTDPNRFRDSDHPLTYNYSASIVQPTPTSTPTNTPTSTGTPTSTSTPTP